MHPFREWLSQLDKEGNLLELAEEFFVVFSRFEYALKRAGFAHGNDKGVEPDWDSFATQYGEKLTEMTQNNQDIMAVIEFFRKEPPRKQILQGEALGWKYTNWDLRILSEKERVTLLWLVHMVRRVRNNLFHGSKIILSDSRQRDLKLLQFGLVLLRCWLDLDEEVKEHFIEGLPGEEILRVNFCSSPFST